MFGFGSMRNSAILGKKRFVTGSMPSYLDGRFGPPPSGNGQEEQPISQVPPPMPEDIEEPPEPPQSEASKYYDEIESIRTKRGPAVSAYQKGLREQPTNADYKPSFWRKLGGAAIAGLSAVSDDTSAGEAIELGSNFIRSPYKRAMEDYGNRMKGLGASAKLEINEVESQLKSLREARALGLDYDEFKLKKLEAASRMKIDEGQLDVQRGNLDVNRANSATTAAGQKDLEGHRAGILKNQSRTAATGERNASTNAANAASLATHRKDMVGVARERIKAATANAAARANKASPSAQEDAINGALRQLQAHPLYKNYIEGSYEDNTLDMKEDDGSSPYQDFMKRVKEITERQLQKGTPFGDEFNDMDDDEDEDLVIEPWLEQ